MNLYAIEVLRSLDNGANIAFALSLGYVIRSLKEYEATEISKVDRIVIHTLAVSTLLCVLIPRWNTLNVLFR